jgi:hypothetical protein
MKRTALSILWLLIPTLTLAQTYSNANLNGKYSFQFATPAYDTWFKTFACPTNSSVTFTATGSTTTSMVTYGIATFNGSGNVNFNATNNGKLNATASATTMSVTWNSSCQVTSVNSGHVVYMPTSNQTGTGTYSVHYNGTGTLTITGGKGSLTLQLAATDGAGISNTVMLISTQANGSSIGAGIAVHQ